MCAPAWGWGKMSKGRSLRWILAVAALVALGVILAYFVGRPTGAPDEAVPGQAAESAPGSAGAGASMEVPAQPGAGGGQAPSAESAWVVVDPDSVDELPPYKEVVPGRALVRVSKALRLGLAGGRIRLEVPQIGQAFDGVIERTDQDPYGNLSYIGLLTEANGENFRFIITAGKRNTFAHIGTSRGTFELVASAELGWLMPTANMDQHVDYSRPDYFIIEEPPPDVD